MGQRARLLVIGGPFALALAAACGLTVEGVAPPGADGGAGAEETSAPLTPIEDAGVDADSGEEVDCGASRENPRACGRCGRDCGGGTCVDAGCTPYVINDGGVAGPWYASVDDTHVYVTSFTRQGAAGADGDLYRIPKAGGPSEKIASFNNAFDVLALSNAVAVGSLDDDGFFVVPKQPNSQPKKVWTGAESLDIARRDGSTYFTSRGTTNDRVHELQEDGGVKDLVSVANNANIEGIAVDDTFIYYAMRRGEIGRIRRDGTGNDEHWHAAPNVRRLSIDSEAIYWTRDESAHRLTKDKTQEIKLADGVGLGKVELDRFHAYITLDAVGRVVRMNKRDGRSVIDLATNLKRPIGLTDDGTRIFFTEYGNARVWAMTK